MKGKNNLPIYPIPEDIYDENFKYKKYIRETLKKEVGLHKSHIQAISHFINMGCLHVYKVSLKALPTCPTIQRYVCVTDEDACYCWRDYTHLSGSQHQTCRIQVGLHDFKESYRFIDWLQDTCPASLKEQIERETLEYPEWGTAT